MLGCSNLRGMRLPNVDVGNGVVAELMTMNCLLQQMQVHMTEQVQQTQHMVAREEELSVKQEQSHEALHMMMQQLSQQVMQQQQQHQQMMQHDVSTTTVSAAAANKTGATPIVGTAASAATKAAATLVGETLRQFAEDEESRQSLHIE